MLIQLTVQNLAIVTHLDLNLSAGMLVITGETGAGKSIIIDALSIALGERASAEQIRAPHNQAIVTASFDITKLPAVQTLLQQQDLPHDECVIRRIISSDGRSRAYINGHSVAAHQIKLLAPHLVHIHSQHQHHALLDSEYQRQLLDGYAEHPQLLNSVVELYNKWAHTKQQIQQLTDIEQQADRLTLLNYQIQELDSLNLQMDELQQLDQQHTQLAKAEELIAAGQEVDATTSNILEQLRIAQNQIVGIAKIAPSLTSCTDNIKQAIVQVQDANADIQSYFSKLDLDPQQLEAIERRLSNIHALARKLKIAPEFLHEHSEALRTQRDMLAKANERLEQLQQELVAIEQEYNLAAKKLSASRQQAATKLSSKIIAKLKTLEMPNAVFEIKSDPLKHHNPTPHGTEAIHFTVTTNPGQPLGLLKKIASGGELSRISLAIQVITAQQMATPTLILDEVDVGISGKTAATVGALMRELGANAQILCITHLPQVASQGHQHFKVEKLQTAQETSTQITPLVHAERVQELARLMGGVTITPEALAHASKLMEAV
jgi:DNA repair protein RecN (Recombination protein N)